MLVLAACKDATRDAAERDARDQARLASIVTADEGLDRALKAADDASQAGDDAKAASILETTAAHAADDAIGAAEKAPLETDWAKARRESLLAVLHARKDSIAPYAKALRGDDMSAKLAAVETQLALQKFAMEAAKGALAPP